MKTSFFLLLCSILIFCESNSELLAQKGIEIRVVNNSGYELMDLSLFSIKFNNLSPRDTTAYQKLEFDESKDDPMLYCTADFNNLSLFLKNPEKGGNYTYSIDSLDLNNKRIYYNLFVDN